MGAVRSFVTPSPAFADLHQAWVENPRLMLAELNANVRLSMQQPGVMLMTQPQRWQLYANVLAALLASHNPLPAIPGEDSHDG